jgi:protoporphyrinogen IX oxidase
MRLDKALIWLHLAGNIFWIGALTAVAVVMLSNAGEAKVRGEIALKIYLRLAVPAFVISFVAGASRLLMDTGLYLKQPWMHAKLVCALVVIALHHMIGGRAKKMASAAGDAGPTRVLVVVFAASAALAAFFAIMQIPGRG